MCYLKFKKNENKSSGIPKLSSKQKSFRSSSLFVYLFVSFILQLNKEHCAFSLVFSSSCIHSLVESDLYSKINFQFLIISSFSLYKDALIIAFLHPKAVFLAAALSYDISRFILHLLVVFLQCGLEHDLNTFLHTFHEAL
jgi:hypothetical protein